MLTKLGTLFSKRSRMWRAQIFRHYFPDCSHREILDLGGGDGGHIRMILPEHRQITVADMDSGELRQAAHVGLKTLLVDARHPLPFETKSVDLIFCSSVIEHITIPKEEVWSVRDSAEFERRAKAAQRGFAREIARCAKSYFVQTPGKFFLVESHTWLPFVIVLLPRSSQLRTIRMLNRFWPKKTIPDWHLLTYRDMKELFPDADIVVERRWGVPKSLIAIRR
jgi:hypothetical protein